MIWWGIPEAAFLLCLCASVTFAYEDDIQINYADYYNEIPDGEPAARKLTDYLQDTFIFCNANTGNSCFQLFSGCSGERMLVSGVRSDISVMQQTK